MNASDTEVEFLFAVVALQLGFIDAGQFAQACSTWDASRGSPLSDLLSDLGWISDEDRADIDRIVRRKLHRCGGDARRTLDDTLDRSVARSVSSVVLHEDRELGFRTGAGPAEGASQADGRPTADRAQETRDRFRLVRMYARGGLGQVWLARDPVLGREVALKELRPERASDPVSRARLLREARVTGRLEHPGIVTVHELSSRDNGRQTFYAMQFVRGRTLREAVRDYHARHGICPDGVLELHELLEDFIAVCNAVAYAHSRGVIHRDLKGQNVILGDFGEVVVLDWGIAKVVGESPLPGDPTPGPGTGPGEGESLLTEDGHVLGTPRYMSPEQAEGRQESVGFASDIYSLGAILYEILGGRPPFGDSDAAEALRRVSEEAPSPLRSVCPGIPAPLEAICSKALSRRPEDRYAGAAEMAQDVRRWLADEPVSAYEESLPERLGRWGRRHRTAVLCGSALLAASAAGLTALILVVGHEQARTRAAIASEAHRRHWAEVAIAAARDSSRDALRRRVVLAAEHPGDARYADELASEHLQLGDLLAAEGRVSDAESHYRAALTLWTELVHRDPGGPDLASNREKARSRLASVHVHAGNLGRGRLGRH